MLELLRKLRERIVEKEAVEVEVDGRLRRKRKRQESNLKFPLARVLNILLFGGATHREIKSSLTTSNDDDGDDDHGVDFDEEVVRRTAVLSFAFRQKRKFDQGDALDTLVDALLATDDAVLAPCVLMLLNLADISATTEEGGHPLGPIALSRLKSQAKRRQRNDEGNEVYDGRWRGVDFRQVTDTTPDLNHFFLPHGGRGVKEEDNDDAFTTKGGAGGSGGLSERTITSANVLSAADALSTPCEDDYFARDSRFLEAHSGKSFPLFPAATFEAGGALDGALSSERERAERGLRAVLEWPPPQQRQQEQPQQHKAGLSSSSLFGALRHKSVDTSSTRFVDMQFSLSIPPLNASEPPPCILATALSTPPLGGRDRSARTQAAIVPASSPREACGAGASFECSADGDARPEPRPHPLPRCSVIGWEMQQQRRRRRRRRRQDPAKDNCRRPDLSLAPAPLLTQIGGSPAAAVGEFDRCLAAHRFNYMAPPAVIIPMDRFVSHALLALQGVASDTFEMAGQDHGQDAARLRLARDRDTGAAVRVSGYSVGSFASATRGIARTGSQFRLLEAFVERWSDGGGEDSGGQILCAFAVAVGQHLRLHQAAAIELPKSVARSGKGGEGASGPPLPTLLEIVTHAQPLQEQLNMLAELCWCDGDDGDDDDGDDDDEGYQGAAAAIAADVPRRRRRDEVFPRGVRLLSYLHNCALMQGSDEEECRENKRTLLLRLLQRSAAPFLAMTFKWVFQGALQEHDDPHGEFPVRCRALPPANSSNSATRAGGSHFFEEAFEWRAPTGDASLPPPDWTEQLHMAAWADRTFPSFLGPAACGTDIAGWLLRAGQLLRLLRLCRADYYACCNLTASSENGNEVESGTGSKLPPLRMCFTSAELQSANFGILRRRQAHALSVLDALTAEQRAAERRAAEERDGETRAAIADAKAYHLDAKEQVKERKALQAATRRRFMRQILDDIDEKVARKVAADRALLEEEAQAADCDRLNENRLKREAEKFLLDKYARLIDEAEAKTVREEWALKRTELLPASRSALKAQLESEEAALRLELGAQQREEAAQQALPTAVSSAAAAAALPPPPPLPPLPPAPPVAEVPALESDNSGIVATVVEVEAEQARTTVRVLMPPGGEECSGVVETVASRGENSAATVAGKEVAAVGGGVAAERAQVRALQPPGGHAEGVAQLFASTSTDGEQQAEKTAEAGGAASAVVRDDAPAAGLIGTPVRSGGGDATAPRLSPGSGTRVLQAPGGSSGQMSQVMDPTAGGPGTQPNPGVAATAGGIRVLQTPGGDSWLLLEDQPPPEEEQTASGVRTYQTPAGAASTSSRLFHGAMSSGSRHLAWSNLPATPSGGDRTSHSGSVGISGREAISSAAEWALARETGESQRQLAQPSLDAAFDAALSSLLGRAPPLAEERGQESDARQQVPLEAALERCLYAPLRRQIQLVDRTALCYFMDCVRLREHIAALRRYMLLCADSRPFPAQQFLHQIDSLLLSSSQATQTRPAAGALTAGNVRNALSLTLSAAGLDDDPCARLFGYVSTPRATARQFSHTACDALVPTYDLPWPIGIAVPTGVFERCLRPVHKQLLRAERGIFLLDCAWRWLRLLRQVESPAAASNSAPSPPGAGGQAVQSLTRAAYAFQHEARHFAESLLAFMKTQLRAASHTLETSLFESPAAHGAAHRTTTLATVAAHYAAFARTASSQVFLPVDGGGDVGNSSDVLAAIGDLQARVASFCERIDSLLRQRRRRGPPQGASGEHDDGQLSTAVAAAALRDIVSSHSQFRDDMRRLCGSLGKHRCAEDEDAGGESEVWQGHNFAGLLLARLNFNGQYN